MDRLKTVLDTSVLALGFRVYALEGTIYRGGLVSQLVDIPVNQYAVGADLSVPEEAAAFYDDLDHALNIELQLQRLALSELCARQTRLF